MTFLTLSLLSSSCTYVGCRLKKGGPSSSSLAEWAPLLQQHGSPPPPPPAPRVVLFFLAASSAVGAKFKPGSRQSIPHNVVHIFLLFVSPNDDIPLKGMHACVLVQRRI